MLRSSMLNLFSFVYIMKFFKVRMSLLILNSFIMCCVPLIVMVVVFNLIYLGFMFIILRRWGDLIDKL